MRMIVRVFGLRLLHEHDGACIWLEALSLA